MICKPVPVPRGGFIFCRTSLAVVFWLAFVFRLPGLLAAAALILGLSALLGIRRAPLVWLWNSTLGRVVPSRIEYLDQNAMRFAHGLGFLLSAAATALLYLQPPAGRVLLFVLCLAKTAGALGFCTAQKLYQCVSDDTCCTWLRRRT